MSKVDRSVSPYSCSICHKSFSRPDNLLRHQRQIHSEKQSEYACSLCSYRSVRKDNVTRHVKRYHTGAGEVRFDPPDEPQSKRSKQAGTETKNDDSEFSGVTEETEKNEIEQLLEANRHRIKSYRRKNGKLENLYNFEVNALTVDQLKAFALKIFSDQKSAFKLNVALGFILMHKSTQRLIFRYASRNTRVLKKPVLIRESKDVAAFSEELGEVDLLEYCRNQRPNSEYTVLLITNALFYCDLIPRFHLGKAVELPPFIRNRRCIISLNRNTHGNLFSDNLCTFRCLAYFRTRQHPVNEKVVKKLFDDFCLAFDVSQSNFEGLDVSDLPKFEDCFRVNVEAYCLEMGETDIDNSLDDSIEQDFAGVRAVKVFTSRRCYNETMHLNLYRNHFSFIKDIHTYSKCWSCRKCSRLFDHQYNCEVHERNCVLSTKMIFPGGGYGKRKSIFEECEEYGIFVEPADRFYPFFIVFDYECLSVPVPSELQNPSNRETLEREQVPASVCICSNVPNFTDAVTLISTGDPGELVERMYMYMVDISTAAAALVREKLAHPLLELEMRALQFARSTDEAEKLKQLGDPIETETAENTAYLLKPYTILLEKLEKWIDSVPTLSFNGGRYDIQVIRQYLFPFLLGKGWEPGSIIKKGNDYVSVTTKHCLFLDIKNFTAGCSYAKWIASFGVEGEKGIWPYEWWTSLDQLNETSLPPAQAFRSNLKQTDLSPSDYQKVQELWQTNGFRTMRDLLVHYSESDVVPFRAAATKLCEFWKSQDIDCFKSSVTLPGLAANIMLNEMEPHTILPLFNENTKHLYELVRNNVVGGPSLVNHRYHEAGKTTLPSGEKTAWVYSFDCNSMYVAELSKPFGTGLFRIFEPENPNLGLSVSWQLCSEVDERYAQLLSSWHLTREKNMNMRFKLNNPFKYARSELEWLEWVSFSTNSKIEHKYNGRQKVVPVSKKVRFWVDGYNRKTNAVLQFHGCWFHGHGCRLDGERDPDQQMQRRRKTQHATETLQNLGYTVIEKWECDWSEEKRNRAISEFLEKHFNLAPISGSVSAADLIKMIQDDRIFGAVEVDIEVPWFDGALVDRYDAFPVIFKNTLVGREDIGPFMRQYAEENGYLKKPVRSLVSSFWARKMLFSTPLIKWYLDHGLVITRIYQFIEMKRKECFARIPDIIADKRRQADSNPDHAVTGSMWKLCGNAMYGKPLTLKERHKRTLLALEQEAPRYINDKRFCKMESVGDAAYEICMDKRVIKQDLPLFTSFFILCGGKLRLCQFAWDMLFAYLRPGSFQICCTDTDSVWAAYASKNLDDLVRKDKKKEYDEEAKQKFFVTDKYSERTPGLFHEEWSGTGLISLNSKCYISWNDESATKRASKGLSKVTNSFTKDDYMRVLTTKQKGSGTNYGFRVVGDKLFQYRQDRAGLAYLFAKRETLPDGVSTRALRI